MFTNGRGNDASRIEVRVGADHSLDGLEVGNGGSIRAANKGFAVLGEASLNHRDYFVPVLGEPRSSTCFIELAALEAGEDVAGELGLKILDKVDERVNLPGDCGVLSVVSKANTKHAKDTARLAVLLSILFPNGHGAERESCLQLGKSLETLTIILILEAGVTEKGANSFSTTTEVEVSELTWHLILKS